MKDYCVDFGKKRGKRWYKDVNAWGVAKQLEEMPPFTDGIAEIKTTDDSNALILLVVKWQKELGVQIKKGKQAKSKR